MDAPPSAHPTDQTLSSFGLGKLDDASAGAVQEHLMECQACRQRVAQISADSFLERVREAQKPPDRPPTEPMPDGATKSYEDSRASSPPPRDALPPGLADHPDYEIKKELGRGGMGVVYLAHNTLMGRDEVLKVMGRQIVERPGVLDRFLREIRAVARLRHPNIVTAYSAIRVDESIVFAMEYVDGLDLARMVKAKGPLPVAYACNFIYQAALGLQHAHEEGLVHRDIKPGNLMLSRKGAKPVVKVLDFGLAKATREQKVDGGLTHEGQALGTPDFIAPEQIQNAPDVDIRADIYSLGGTLYYLLTGRPPFKANSLYDIYQAHISREAEPLNLVRPEVPSELAAVVSKMMAKEPERRFQTPGEVARALEAFFKKGSAVFKGPKPDLSQAVQTRDERPATAVGGPDVGVVTGPEVREPRWESLIEIPETKPEIAPEPVAAFEGRPPRPRWPVALATGSLGLLLLLGIVITIRCDKQEVPGKPSLPPEPPRSLTNSIGMKLMLIPAGEFDMGTTPEEMEVIFRTPDVYRDWCRYEQPQHHVRITRPFYLGATEVTRGQFRRFVEAEGYQTDAERSGGGKGWNASTSKVEGYSADYSWRNLGFEQTDEHPVLNVSWNDAVAYCAWLSQTEKVIYRLPTEAEWEYACRAGTTSLYSSGNDPESLVKIGNLWDESLLKKYPDYQGIPPITRPPVNFKASDGYVHTAPVGQFQPNAFGLYDMLGNVAEWCNDWFDADYYKQSPVEDPPGPSRTQRRVARGCAWSAPAWFVRPAARGSLTPDSRREGIGFRVVREIPTSRGTPEKAVAESRAVSPAADHRRSNAQATRTVTFRQGVNGYEGCFGLSYQGSVPRPGSRNLWSAWPDPGDEAPVRQQGHFATLKFDDLFAHGAGRVAPGSSIVLARLRLVTGPRDESSQGDGAAVHRLEKPVDFLGVASSLLLVKDAADHRYEIVAPSVASIGSATLKEKVEPGPIELDVTADVQAWASGTLNIGWVFVPWPNGSDGWGFRPPYCPDEADRPSLTITFVPPGAGD